MTVEAILAGLIRINVVASFAILLVLLLRPLVLRWLGANVAYRLWLVVPVAVAASFLPPRERIVVVSSPEIVKATREPASPLGPPPAVSEEAFEPIAVMPSASVPALADALVALWLLGAVALLVRSTVSTRRLATDPSIGPALVGVFRPRLVLPSDFETRFDAQERALILAHEEVHRLSGHTVVNAVVEVARCANWFNPLVHLAAHRLRTDQELACDATVIAARPSERRAYAQALLKAQRAPAFLRLGCVWTSRSGAHLRERIAMLGRASLDRRGAVAGAAIIVVLSLTSGYAAWAQQPERRVTQIATPRPNAVWTPASGAPKNLLTEVQARNHDSFIDRARAGNIDLVFFGTTDTAMWSWPDTPLGGVDRGKRVWDQAFGSLKAANFGSGGTHSDGLLWRMQNGELDGYQAKLVVLHGVGVTGISGGQPIGNIGDLPIGDRQAEFVAGYARLIAEIRARQPQAKILILPSFPRGRLRREEWRTVADANAVAYRRLTDDTTVFYANFGDRFFLPDGSHNQKMWNLSGPVPNAGIHEPGFKAWAEELQPWLDRFVR
jgi:beta-lactamase regulating signal transducer with metallopeptidase domain